MQDTDRLLRPADGGNEVAPRTKFVGLETAELAFNILGNPDRALTFRYPITSAPNNFGVIEYQDMHQVRRSL